MKNMKNIINRAKKIKLLAMDIDGVLTKGELIILNSGEEVKIWDIKDRLAFSLLEKSGLDIKLAWISARASKQIEDRAKELKIDFFYENCSDKSKVIQEIIEKANLKYEEIAYIGDDFIDIPVLKKVSLAVCPKDAPKEVKKNCHYVSSKEGGKGVLRELIEIIIKSKGKWDDVLKLYEV